MDDEDQDKALKFYTEILGSVKKRDFLVGQFKWLTVVSPEEPDGTELLLEPCDNPAATLVGVKKRPSPCRGCDFVSRSYPAAQAHVHGLNLRASAHAQYHFPRADRLSRSQHGLGNIAARYRYGDRARDDAPFRLWDWAA